MWVCNPLVIARKGTKTFSFLQARLRIFLENCENFVPLRRFFANKD